ncbi:acyl-CoA dehydrogenase family protein [Deinococcus yavapaiensis]|uniref:Glutaryl-CoA dehydrogenase n=1 Tax=Deinococcus yavapaiensis KR-236 TaxID=694435 RepID=A0A318S9E6_9DEIO|nr:acyl-CoA dehydrogenase family protein [Deinococcus yavapaiensis]PYE53651.1 glutaryl-CoA dehydrogenase [Deinococcus yavapaiensis KR-236]
MLDFLSVRALLTSDERAVWDVTRDFVTNEVLPHVGGWWDEDGAPRDLLRTFGRQGLLGPTLPEAYGGSESTQNAYGAAMYELERADSGLRSLASVQGSLVMGPIYRFGSEDLRRRFLPGLASGELVGCFGLTEEGGSDPGAMRTRAVRDGDAYVLNGSKVWITNAPHADVAVVWAHVAGEGKVGGFVVETDTAGFRAPKIDGKLSLRTSVTGEIVLEDVRVPASHRLEGARGLGAPLSCLTDARFGIAWGALGALETVFETAREFASGRVTFGSPIASRQLVQEKLARMLADHAKGLLLAWRIGVLKEAGQHTHAQVSLAKRDNVRAALNAARSAREVLGASGITTAYPVMRHLLNLETVDTYEGTHDIHTLVLGREITGISAFG